MSGLFAPGELNAWSARQFERIRRGAARGLAAGGRAAVPAFRNAIAAGLDLKSKKLPGSVTYRVHANIRSRLPVLDIYSKVPWVGIHTTGGTIRGPLLIPMNQARRMGKKRFRAIVDSLMRSGNAYFRQVNGKAILFAENIAENAGALKSFKSGFRKAAGIKRLKKGTDVPIAVLLPRVTLRKRINWRGTADRQRTTIAAAVRANALKR